MQLSSINNISTIFSMIKPEAHSFNKKRLNESLSHFTQYNIKHSYEKGENGELQVFCNFSNHTNEFKTICNWRINTYTLKGKIRKTSILYKVFNRTNFTTRELALAESVAQWLGTYVGQSWIQYKTKKKNWEEYGVIEFPNLNYIALTQLSSKDYDFLYKLTDYLESSKALNYLNKNFYGLYEILRRNY